MFSAALRLLGEIGRRPSDKHHAAHDEDSNGNDVDTTPKLQVHNSILDWSGRWLRL